jgi:GTP cyclohydrolase III
MVDSFVDNAVAVTNLANNLAMVNMETIQAVADTNREALRVGVDRAKNLRKSLVEP